MYPLAAVRPLQYRHATTPLVDRLGLQPSGAWSPVRRLKRGYAGALYEAGSGTLHGQLGLGHDLTPDGGTGEAPALSTMGPNGRACLLFDGTNDRLSSAGAAWAAGSVFSRTDTYIVLACQVAYADLSIDAPAAYDNPQIIGDAASNLGLHVRAGGVLYAFGWDGGEKRQVLAIPDDQACVIELLLTGGTISGRVNKGTWGTPVAIGQIDANFAGIEFAIGVNYSGVRLRMKLGDVLIFKDIGIPDSAKKDKIVDDLMSYWALALASTIGNTAQRDPNDRDTSARGNVPGDLWFSATGKLWQAASVAAPAVWTKINPPATLPGDLGSNLICAYGRKALTAAAVSGPWLDLWQDDNHAATASLSFDAQGQPDLAGLATAIGGNFGRVTKLYDHSANAHHNRAAGRRAESVYSQQRRSGVRPRRHAIDDRRQGPRHPGRRGIRPAGDRGVRHRAVQHRDAQQHAARSRAEHEQSHPAVQSDRQRRSAGLAALERPQHRHHRDTARDLLVHARRGRGLRRRQ